MASVLSDLMSSFPDDARQEKERLLARWASRERNNAMGFCDSEEVHEVISILEEEIAIARRQNRKRCVPKG